MEKSKSTLGNILNNIADGSLGEMKHSIETKSIVWLCVGILVTGIALIAIKKFVFKSA